jgi:uncharacterized protein YjbI with pentapeptide repeats
MDRTKLTAFLLLVASLGAALFVFDLASAPFLLSDVVKYPDGTAPPLGCMAFVILVVFLPLAAIPGIAGLIIWLRTVRKRAVERTRELASWPAQEMFLQDCYDKLALALSDTGRERELVLIHKSTEQLGAARRDRWHRFLTGSEVLEGHLFPRSDPKRPAEPVALSERGLRIFALALSLFGFFCFLWAALTAVTQLSVKSSLLVGLQPGPKNAWIGASGCLIPGITSIVAGLGLIWLLRGGRRSRLAEGEWRDRAREILLERCVRRLEGLRERGLATSQSGSTLQKVDRASLLDAFAELDGERKAWLLLAVHAQGLTKTISLQGADLRNAKLDAGGDLSGALLAGIDFSGAVLTSVGFEQSDLRSCCFVGADLRKAILCGADLRQSDLRNARLHQGNLQKADLRNADLRGATLWQVDFSGADLRDCFVNVEQLMQVASVVDASLPFVLPLMEGVGKTAEI